jgi:hypothetical protein
MRSATLWMVLLGGCAASLPTAATMESPTEEQPSGGTLRTPESFEALPPEERSRALFVEASRVLRHPRCSNCHPAGDSPLQGSEARLHEPPIARGPLNMGAAGLECTSCHQDANVPLSRVPGAPHWQLAPRAMAWTGKGPVELCEQLKERNLNGGRTLQQLLEHVSADALVAWGWAPGAAREPAPGTQAAFADLIAAWISTGAQCPTPGAP